MPVSPTAAASGSKLEGRTLREFAMHLSVLSAACWVLSPALSDSALSTRHSALPLVVIHRIDVLLIRLLRLFERGLELLLEDAGAVLLALELAIEAFRRFALLRLQACDHRL